MRKIFCPILLLLFTTVLSAQEVMYVNNAIIALQSGATMYVNGGIRLAAGSTIQNNGAVILNSHGAGAADLIDQGTFIYPYGTGIFSFTGIGTHGISTINLFGQLQVNSPVTLNSNVTAFQWHLKSGRITTGAFTASIFSTDANALDADAANPEFTSSWFEGNLRRYIDPVAVDRYVFPVGDASMVHEAELDNLSTNPLTGITYIDARFTPKPGTDAGLNVQELGASYTSVHDGGAWHLVPDANPTGGRYDLILHINGFNGLTDNSFALLMRPDASVTASDWQAPAASFLPPANALGRTVAGGIARRNNLSVFGQAGIGLTIKPLPLTLLSFTARKSGNDILLQWTTSHESNTNHFEILKGQQAGSLNYFDKVTALGNTTNDHTYDYSDNHPYAGVNYYQLRMVDNDNRFTLSQVIKINAEEAIKARIYPNPALNNEVFIDLQGVQPKDIKLFAADGTLVRIAWSTTATNVIKLNLPATLSHGLYTIQILTAKGTANGVVIVQ